MDSPAIWLPRVECRFQPPQLVQFQWLKCQIQAPGPPFVQPLESPNGVAEGRTTERIRVPYLSSATSSVQVEAWMKKMTVDGLAPGTVKARYDN